MAIGEAGSITASSPSPTHEITVTFAEAITNPVIALTGSANGDPYVLRVTEIQTNADGNAIGFSFRIEEWEYLDDIHTTVEDINWIAVEAGVHTLPDGRVIEAGTTSATHDDSEVTFAGSFSGRPVVLTSVMSGNDLVAVDSDPSSIDATGFTVSLEEEEGKMASMLRKLWGISRSRQEVVPLVALPVRRIWWTMTAIHTGWARYFTYGLGEIFSNPVILGETQTQNGPDPGNVMLTGNDGSSADFFFQEERSANVETNHAPEGLGIVAFEAGLIMCFTPECQVATPHGARRIADVTRGDAVLTRDSGIATVRARTETRLCARQLRDAPDLAPVLIARGALGPGVPDRDLIVSPQHRLLMASWYAELTIGEREVLVPAKALVNGRSIRRLGGLDEVTYMHLVLDSHQIVTVNNVRSESLHLGHANKASLGRAARETLFALVPGLRSAPQSWGPPVRPVVSVQEGRLLATEAGVRC